MLTVSAVRFDTASMFEPKLAEALSVADTGKSSAQLVYTRIELQNGQDEHLITYGLYARTIIERS